MHAEIQRTQMALQSILANQLPRLRGLSTREVRDLMHEADDLARTRQGTERVAAQMTVSLCEAVLED